ncbi:hypothetical protein BDD21_5491 [Thiocapsa rosea]|uniref:Uncharacterized protein n=1 Tax=Thiocapsa rosea TaxID=69360 RepID=A0A495UPM0_9GAMM|nr:hypothetical protein BDD21_5491 [Thiocapsa rosea]
MHGDALYSLVRAQCFYGARDNPWNLLIHVAKPVLQLRRLP